MARTYDLQLAQKTPDAWWTVAVIDPIALRILPHLLDRRRITPDGLSLTSLALALLAGVAFLLDELVVGAVLFELHFLFDCLDGKVARVRGTQNPRGGFVDLACDLVGTAWCFAALGFVAFQDTDATSLSLVTALAYVTYTWSTVQRSRSVGLSAKPAREGGWLARHRFGRTPYGVEVETLTLFLVPITQREDWVRVALYVGAGFFVMATFRNLRATYRSLASG